MAHEMTRRVFCGSAMAAAVAAGSVGSVAGAAESKGAVKFFKNLSPGHLGVRANSQQTLDYAVKYGFGGIAPSEGEFENKSAAEIGQWLAMMKDKGVRYGAAGLSVEFRGSDEKFRDDLAQYPKRAALLKQLGVTARGDLDPARQQRADVPGEFQAARDPASRGGQDAR